MGYAALGSNCLVSAAASLRKEFPHELSLDVTDMRTRDFGWRTRRDMELVPPL
jgi:hypothetical protein